jgi:uncharacterized protein (TIGR03643 family)
VGETFIQKHHSTKDAISCFILSMNNSSKNPLNLSEDQIDRVIEMAWEDRTPFEAIVSQFGLVEKEVIALMRRHMKRSSFNMWRKRVQGRATKHLRKRDTDIDRFRCSLQRTITLNKISKR